MISDYKAQPKSEVMFYLVDFLRTSGLGCNIPDSSEGLLQRGKEETRIYIYRSFYHRRSSQNIKRLLFKNQTSQVNTFSAFLCLGRCKESGFTEIVPVMYTSAL